MPDPQTEEAREADDMGERPDLGRTPDALTAALSGTDSGSDTRAGSLEGGAATGSDIDPDQDAINQTLASNGRAPAGPQSPSGADPDPIKNTGGDLKGAAGAPAEGARAADPDAASG